MGEAVDYDPKLVASFYDAYGYEEWQRLEATAKGRLMLALHLRFLERQLPRAARVLDAGCGPGRFAVEMARRGARVTLLDLSPGQLAIARQKVREAGVEDRVEGYLRADVCDLATLPDGAFDLTLCYGGALNYPLGREARAAHELARVTRPDGRLVVGVMSLWGANRYALAQLGTEFIGQAEKYRLWEVVNTGTIPPLTWVRQPPRHLFTSGELRSLLEGAGCRVLEMACAPCLGSGLPESVEELARDPVAWTNLVELEVRAGAQPGLLDVGEHLLAAAEVTP